MYGKVLKMSWIELVFRIKFVSQGYSENIIFY